MARLMLNVPVEVEIIDGKEKEKLKVNVRDFTKEERQEAKKTFDKYNDLSLRLGRLQSKLASATKKASYSEKLKKYADALNYQKKVDELETQLEKLLKEVNDLGGQAFTEKQAKSNFERLVTGDGSKRLSEVAESRSYVEIMGLLHKAKKEVEGKPDDE